MFALVLVHGSMHGPWCFEPLLPHLSPRVFASVRSVDVLSCKSFEQVNKVIGEVVNEEYEKGRKVMLLGHSLGGMHVSQAAEALADRLSLLVYVAAYLPADGESRTDIQSRFGIKLPFTHTEQGVIASKQTAQQYLYNESPEDVVDWAIAKLRPQPSPLLTQKVTLTEARFGSVPKAYALCSRDRTIPYESQQWMVARRKEYRDVRYMIDLPSDHFPQFCMPKQLGEWLSGLASGANAKL